ncbi:hypothetical protein BP5796_12731 [Coleophoma crateriformis]|uniref:Uncharacterized protein n=1 Tax=Coleophoma crateriformis TaxID=565419 RepID=A0A3D8Q645_9HELO|nr:hypothetical protein BP5796_12731 [Coleophoma crateriformis]
MLGPTATTGADSNGFLSPNPLGVMSNTASARDRSASISPSVRSSTSRITLVEDNHEVASYQGTTAQVLDDTYKVKTIQQPQYNWIDHLFGLFFYKRRRDPIVTEEYVNPESAGNHHVGIILPGFEASMILTTTDFGMGQMNDDSPWVLPVFVLSSRMDTGKHNLPKLARCTIDTGNQQGNVVSREFVETVLEYSASNFCELTKEEEKGGRSVTGHILIPDGAIYLTWYHKKSTRVFRNMRFLVSPIGNYDMIIGARSIKKDNILDVPNLMVDKLFSKEKEEDPKRNELSSKVARLEERVGNLKSEHDKQKDPKAKKDSKDRLTGAKQRLAIAKTTLEIFDVEPGPNYEEEVRKLDAKLKELTGNEDKGPTALPEPSTTHSTAVDTRTPGK